MNAKPDRRAYWTLDGLRGVGAFLVVMRHVPMLFGPIRVPESFLAVDLFYLVSGFVVAHAYGERLKAGGFFWAFVKTRLIRLYPLYAVGLALGVVVAAIAVITDPSGWWTPGRLAEGVVTGALMIPIFPGLRANGASLDGPTWTLVPELIANALYAALVRYLNLAGLMAIILVSGVGVAFAELHYGTLDVGYSATDQWAALARVGFSFFSGVLVFRLAADKRQDSDLASWICMGVLTLILAWRPTDDQTPYFELGAVMIVFPALLVAATRFEPNPVIGRAFAYIGLVSYGVYLVHQPLGNLVRQALHGRFTVPGDARGLVFGAIFLASVTALAGWLDRRVDAPVRQWLRARFLPAGAKPKTGA